MKETLQTLFHQHKRHYGARRIIRGLNKHHSAISLYKTRRLIAQGSLQAIQPKSFVPRTTDSRHSYSISPNLLKDRPLPITLNQIWVGDITYIPMADGSFPT